MNKEDRKEYDKQYRLRNLEEYKQKKRDYMKRLRNNPETNEILRKRSLEWFRNNKEQVHAYQKEKRDRKKSFAEIWEEEKSKYQNLYKKELKENKGLVKLGIKHDSQSQNNPD